MKKDKKLTLGCFKKAAKIKTGQKKAKKIDSYFDGEKYRGYSVKTLMIRENAEKYNPIKADNAAIVYQMFKELENLDQERFYSVVLDGNNNVLAVHLISQGTINQSLVHPREVFKTAILCSGAGLILVHNHPSGEVEPSTQDIVITQWLLKASEIMGIEIIDHIIIGYQKYCSLKSKGLIEIIK
jgi:DNA repair protein RadC